jgi:antitoxin (DNA-binding transcriptional repressor) of toxin-antitoxin stability system
MADVSIRDLRNSGGEVVDRAARGEPIRITRAGQPVAELRALPATGPSASTLLERWRNLPAVDPIALRRDLDQVMEPRL